MVLRFWMFACISAASAVSLPTIAQQFTPAPQPEAPAALYQNLLELDALKAFRAMRRLAAMPGETVSYLSAAVPPAAKTATPKQIETLIRQLDSERFAERDKARQELERLDWQAVEALRHAAGSGSTLELRRRIEQLIARAEGLLMGANLRWHRTVEVVEWIGSPAAKKLLEAWGAGAPECRLTQEANKALKRWGSRPVTIPSDKHATVDAQGDPLPPGAILRLGSTRWRMEDRGDNSLVYTPDGKRLIVVGGAILGAIDDSDGKIVVRQESNRYGGWSAGSARLSPDGKRLVAAGFSYGNQMRFPSLRVFDSQDLKEISQWPLEGTVLGFAEKGNVVLLGMANGIQQFDLQAGRPLEFFPLPKDARGPILALHGKTAVVAATNRDQLLVYDLSAPEKTKILEFPGGIPRSSNFFAISPDGKVLACGSDYDWGLLLYDVDSGKPIRQVVAKDGTRNTVSAPAFSPDGKTLVFNSRSGNNSELVAWDMELHKPRWKTDGGGSAAAFAPDGRFIAGRAGTRFCVWEATTGKEITGRAEPAAASITDLAFSSNGANVLTVQANTVRLWDFPAGKSFKEFSHPQVHLAALSPDGRRLASSSFNHGLRIWDTGTGREFMRLPDKGSQTGYAREFVFSQDSQRLLSWESNYRLQVWNVNSGRLVAEHLPRPEGFPKDLFDDDDRPRRRRGFDKEFDILGSRTGFSADGARLIFHFNKLHLYDTDSGKEVQTFEKDVDSGYYRPQTSMDREWLLIGGGNDQPRTLINLRLGKKVGQVLFGNDMHSGAPAMAPDGRCFALETLAGADRSIVFYETATLAPRLKIPVEYGYAYRLAFSPEGRFLAAAMIDGTVLVWDTLSLEN